MFSGHQQHCNVVFTPSTLDAFQAELDGFELGAGAVKIPYDVEVPRELLGRMMAHRVREWGDEGVTWR